MSFEIVVMEQQCLPMGNFNKQKTLAILILHYICYNGNKIKITKQSKRDFNNSQSGMLTNNKK